MEQVTAEVVVRVYSTVWPGTAPLSFRMETSGLGCLPEACSQIDNLHIRHVVAERVGSCRERYRVVEMASYKWACIGTSRMNSLPQV